MKVRLCMATLSIALGLAAGQTPPPNPRPRKIPSPPRSPTPKQARAATPGTTALAEMKTTNFKGVLVDMACASRSSAWKPNPPAPRRNRRTAETKPAASDTGELSVSASSSEIGMKLDDGKTVRFDMVGINATLGSAEERQAVDCRTSARTADSRQSQRCASTATS